MSYESATIVEDLSFGKENIIRRLASQGLTSVSNRDARNTMKAALRDLESTFDFSRIYQKPPGEQPTPFQLRSIDLTPAQAEELEDIRRQPSGIAEKRFRRMKSID
jgi:hypothetical protein